MSKGNNNEWDFDPSSEGEFVRNIEKALQNEEKQAKISIDYNGGIQIIDDDTNENTDAKTNEIVDRMPMQHQTDTEGQQADATNTDDFALLEEAVHRVAEIKIEEDLDKIQENEDSDVTIVDDITRSLAKQTDHKIKEESSVKEESVKNYEKKNETKRVALWKRIVIPVICVFLTLLLVFLFIRFTKLGQDLAIKTGAWFAASRIHYEDGSEQEEQIVEDEVELEHEEIKLQVVKPEDVELHEDEGIARHEDYATNILLLGEETIDSGTARGRTDVILILTLNTKDKSIKLTSLMRDMYIQIPGHLDNKLNSAYATGGIQLLYDTIELNFNIKLDGYALVGFNSFEDIIDKLGGVDIFLTKEEADWLNKTNYISNPMYRNVTEGMNHMNGNQALGYCRIPSVGTAEREYDDFGRTSRHRIVLDAILHKYQSLGFWDLATLTNSCLPMITTDLDAGEIEQCLKRAVDIGLDRFEQNRIPANDTFEYVNIRKMNVIVPDLTKNVEILQKFIFGDEGVGRKSN
ncbi:MAG: LCP family protein [Clostridiales bacterium]|nr:LCP family protein [Clostridiales bacterium]